MGAVVIVCCKKNHISPKNYCYKSNKLVIKRYFQAYLVQLHNVETFDLPGDEFFNNRVSHFGHLITNRTRYVAAWNHIGESVKLRITLEGLVSETSKNSVISVIWHVDPISWFSTTGGSPVSVDKHWICENRSQIVSLQNTFCLLDICQVAWNNHTAMKSAF